MSSLDTITSSKEKVNSNSYIRPHKLQRINGKHVRHSANINSQLVIEKETTFFVKSSTPFVSGLKRINKMLNKFNKTITRHTNKYQGGEYKKVKYITVKGMGKSIENTLGIANKLQNDLHYKVDILTGTVEVLDEFEPFEEQDHHKHKNSIDDITFQKRKVSTIELRIWLKRE